MDETGFITSWMGIVDVWDSLAPRTPDFKAVSLL
jgi:hypothetical protein